jgi:cyclin-dependent kinase 2
MVALLERPEAVLFSSQMVKRQRDEGRPETSSSPLVKLCNQVESLQSSEIEAQMANRLLAPALREFIDQCKDHKTVSQLTGFGWEGNEFKTNVDLQAFDAFLKKSKYQILEQLGSGAYSHVYKGRNTVTNEFVALKKVKYDQQRGLSSLAVREISILKSLEHENVLQLKDIIGHCSSTSLYYVLEYLDCDLHGYIYDVGDVYDIKNILRQILKGINHMHSKLVMHRDLKPQNILVNKATGVVKLADFGLSRDYLPPFKAYTEKVVTLCYRAPEILLGSEVYSCSVDMWSIGCIMAELFNLQPLFLADCEFGYLIKILSTLGTPTLASWPALAKMQHYSAEFPDWPPISLAQVVPRLKGDPLGLDLLERLLTYDPLKRITARGALLHPWFLDQTPTLSRSCSSSGFPCDVRNLVH